MTDYKEKYEQAISRAKETISAMTDMGGVAKVDDILHIFPELKESGDNRIKNLIYCLIRDRSDNRKLLEHNGVTVEEALAWLEKQGEQELAEWSLPYRKNETAEKLIALAECLEMDGDCLFNGYTGTECGKFLRDLARKQVECKSAECSEEDKKYIANIIAILEGWDREHLSSIPSVVPKCIDWLKSLKPQNRWEPSDEQLRPLGYAIDYFKKKKNDTTYLESLYNDLKNLRS